MSDTENYQWMEEQALANALGVPRHIIKKMRPHTPAGGVRPGKAGAIEWREDAVTDAALKLQLPPPPQFAKKAATPEGLEKIAPVQPPPLASAEAVKPSAAPAAPPAPVPNPDGGEELTVHSKPLVNGKHFANPIIIQAKRSTGELVYVRVMDSAKFQPCLRDDKGPTTKPMTLRAKKSTAGNWWELLSRAPRWPGRY